MINKKSIDEAVLIFEQNSVLLAPKEDLKKKLAKKDILKIKFGADPTAPDLHLGHAVVLLKLKKLQELGHQIIFLIGDFTALIGDPTGKSKTRPPLTKEQVSLNAKTYFEQVFKILDKDKTTIVYNSEWLSPLNFTEVIKLCAKTTVMQLLEREDFKNRLQNQSPIGFHELLYPILQGYDSVALEADVELGGTDQTFNLMFGRHMQEQFGQEPQVVLTSPILEGLDGKNKMSKSLNNYVGLTEDPINAYGKLMSLPDESLFNYFKLLLGFSKQDFAELEQRLNHPMLLKKEMAFLVVEAFWGRSSAEQGKRTFEELFQKQNYQAATEFVIQATSSCVELWIADLVKDVCKLSSNSEAKRLIESGAVWINDQKITDFKQIVSVETGAIFKAGKKIFKLTISLG